MSRRAPGRPGAAARSPEAEAPGADASPDAAPEASLERVQDAAAGPDRRALVEPGWQARLARRLAVVAALVALDLWSKAAIFDWLSAPGTALVPDACDFRHRRLPLIGEWLALMLSRNPGAAFGQLDSVPRLLVGGRIAAVLFLIWLLVRTPARSRWTTAALVLVLAGALGNLYDNLFLEPPPHRPFGYVRDFIDVYFVGWRWHFPTFNVADSCITVGAGLLLLSGFVRDGRRGRRAGEAAAPEV